MCSACGTVITFTVPLESGGTIALSTALDFFAMSEPDREFVFSIIDQLRRYERDDRAQTGNSRQKIAASPSGAPPGDKA